MAHLKIIPSCYFLAALDGICKIDKTSVYQRETKPDEYLATYSLSVDLSSQFSTPACIPTLTKVGMVIIAMPVFH